MRQGATSPEQKASEQSNQWSVVPLAMTLLVWNARGLCSVERQREFKEMCNTRSIEIFGALETKTKAGKFKEAAEKMGAD